MRHVWFIYLFLALCTLAVYWPTLSYDFIDYDDPQQVFEKEAIQNGLTWQGIGWSFHAEHWAWHPLTFITHMIDSQVYGVERPAQGASSMLKGPGGHHLTNVLLHMMNAVLLLWVMRKMTGSLWPSVMIAFVFALHPLRVESVAWITERKDVLSTLFGLLAIGFYIDYARQPGRRKGVLRYLAVFVCLGLSLMSKAMLVTLPFLLLLLDLWPLNRIGWNFGRTDESSEFGQIKSAEPDANADAKDGAESDTVVQDGKSDSLPQSPQRKLGWLILEKLPLLGLSVGCIAMTVATAAAYPGGLKSAHAVPFLTRLSNVPVAYAAYLGKLFWPVDLAVMYPLPPEGWSPLWVIGSTVILIVISILVLASVRSRPYLLVGWLWFVGTLFPVSGIMQSGDQAYADRFTYVPLIGITIMLIWLAKDLIVQKPAQKGARRRIAVGLSVAVVVALGVLSAIQVRHWRDTMTLFTHTARVQPKSAVAHEKMGDEYEKTGKFQLAALSYRKVLGIQPDHLRAYERLMILLESQQRFDDVVRVSQDVIRRAPGFHPAKARLGIIFLLRGQVDAAIEQFQAVLADKDCPLVLELQVQFNYGQALLRKGKKKEAAACFQRVLQIDPEFKEARQALERLDPDPG